MATTATVKTTRGAVETALQRAKNKAAVIDKYADQLAAKQHPFRRIPGFSDYEVNAQGVVKSIKTGKVQQIPAGKKKYLIFNDKGERRSIGPEEIINLLPKAESKVKPSKKEKSTEGGNTKKAQILLLHKGGKTAKQISDETGISYNTVYVTIKVHTIMSLHAAGKTPKQIADTTGFSEDSIKWQIAK